MGRWFNFFVIVFWLCSMAWLVTTKILPPLRGGVPQQFHQTLPQKAGHQEPVQWQIDWQQTPTSSATIGTSTQQVVRRADGTGEVRSVVELDNLPVKKVIRELLGSVGALLASQVDETQRMQLVVTSEMYFDSFAELYRFESTVDVDQMQGLIKLQGTVIDDKLKISAAAKIGPNGSTDGVTRPVLKREIRIPPEGLQLDSLAPRSSLKNLRVGQRWTFPSYSSVSPGASLEMIEAHVLGRETINWNGAATDCFVVVYQRDSNSGLTAAGGPFNRMMVDTQGRVLRQELSLANLQLVFRRKPTAKPNTTAEETANRDANRDKVP